MALTVLDSKDLVESLTTGTVIEPKDVLADRAGPEAPTNANGAEKPAEAAAEPEKAAEAPKDEEEGEDGLTARQKAEWTEQMRKTVAKKHARMKDAEEFAAAKISENRILEEQLAASRKELEALKAPKPIEAPKKPERGAFKSEEEYVDALVGFRVAEQREKDRKESAERSEAERQASVRKSAEERIERAKEISPEFAASIEEKLPTDLPGYVAAAMQESEMLPELWYHFVKNPDDVKRITGMRPERALLELGRIESRLKPFAPSAGEKPSGGEPKASNGTAPSADKTDEKSEPETGTTPSPRPRAPAPITPLAAASTAQLEKAVSARTPREEIASWSREHGANLRRRKRS